MTAMTVRLTDNSDKAKKALFYACKAATRKAGRIIAKEAKANISVRSGATKKSIAVKTWKPAGASQVRADVGYWAVKTLKEKGKPVSFAKASWVENGTRPHIIKAGQRTSRGGRTRITGKRLLSNGTTGFGRQFRHPGSKAKRPLQQAAQSKASEVGVCAQEYYKKISQLYKKEESFFSEIAAAAGGEGDTEDAD